ncbi:carbohydrate ABC transporter permease [Paenibacillus sp. PAMC21692]|uniref:carbohydrate ABC transporter permease n=1 Tax=Paenibacillus sp. PAMC21692 TaxID=2762320 RepID=UPI00164D023D|nr:carbohydrate ABC transporter permease [Paenibacillus sp. PAMC21692]QNK56292.1 carbohydrate ABC transporter permease [Paenibacillus sp. PAMC21692]
MEQKASSMDYVWRFILLVCASTILFPLIWVLYQSLKTNVEFFQDVWAFPKQMNWGNYVRAWTSYELSTTLLNTVYYVGASLLLGTFMTTLNAYALTRLKFRFQKLIWASIMFSLFLPGINALIPQYLLMKDLHLINSLTGLVILDSFGENVFLLMLLGGFMASLPKELEESAIIDGASFFQAFLRVIVPLSTPGIVTIAIFKFLGLYNNFLGPFIYLTDPSKYTIAVTMYQANMKLQFNADWVTLFAGVTITMIPSLVLYMAFQRRIMEGATLGAVKG